VMQRGDDTGVEVDHPHGQKDEVGQCICDGRKFVLIIDRASHTGQIKFTRRYQPSIPSVLQ
jgi:hypothetical protein